MISDMSFDEPYGDIGSVGVSGYGNLRGIAIHGTSGRKDEVFHATCDRGFDERSRVDGVVAVIRQRIADRLRNNERRGKMDDILDVFFSDQARKKTLIASIANDKRYARRNRQSLNLTRPQFPMRRYF
jgi:hypothetical protein